MKKPPLVFEGLENKGGGVIARDRTDDRFVGLVVSGCGLRANSPESVWRWKDPSFAEILGS